MTSFEFLRYISHPPLSDEERLLRIQITASAITGVLSPCLVYVFGSAAWGHGFDSNSDIDCLAVIKCEKAAARSWKQFGKIRRQFNWPLDLIVLSEADFLRKKDIGGVAFIATHEGRLIYDDSRGGFLSQKNA